MAQRDETLSWSIQSVIEDSLTIVDQSYIATIYVPTPPKPRPVLRTVSATTLSDKILCSCVLYAKALLSIDEPWGWAGNMKPNIPIASVSVGDVGITREGGGHVFTVASGSFSSGKVVTDESNLKSCATSSREFELDDPDLKGFYRPPTASLSQEFVR